jgi:AcrR family transcriptional regulator
MSTGNESKVRAEYLGPDRRRPQVLDTALEIIADAGLAAVTMGEIATRMEVTRPVVYACYPGRGEVLAALLQRERELVLTSVMGTMPPPRTGSIEQMFVDGFKAFLRTVAQRPVSWRLILGVDSDPVMAAAIASGRAQISAQVAAVMGPLLKRWQVPDLDRALPALAEVFVSIGETAARLSLDSDQRWTIDTLAEVMGPAAYRALRAR